MSGETLSTALILTGPTGAGKSQLGVQLAERLGAEIVSMDSMALYRGMDVGTAKPGPAERQRVPHHLLDVLDPWQSASVAWWLDRAAACSREIEGRGRRVLFVGGTPLYLKALLFGLFSGPPADEVLRARLAEEAARFGPPALHHRLAGVDPAAAARLHPNDLRRVVRALEVWELTGKPLSTWQTQWHRQDSEPPEEPGRPSCIWLDLPREELYTRINRRVEEMIVLGLREEAERLRCLPHPLSRVAAQALGYREMFDHLQGKATLPATIERIQRRSRQFAKRQLTWFRHIPQCRPVSRELTFAAWGLTMKPDGE
jgi:tRNA dimethylallyltransferase